MILGIKFNLNSGLYNRDPQDTKLGQNILRYGIELIDGLGFESFTFKKLAIKIGSTEASIYRYFDNKHSLLLFLTCWYWEWVHYLIQINLKNIEDPKRKLKIIIEQLVHASSENTITEYINENLLHRIIINEGSKAYHTHKVDQENDIGIFLGYKDVVKRIADIIAEINPQFPYKYSLASNLFEMTNNQIYFAEHLPRLTDIQDGEDIDAQLISMLNYFVDKLLS